MLIFPLPVISHSQLHQHLCLGCVASSSFPCASLTSADVVRLLGQVGKISLCVMPYTSINAPPHPPCRRPLLGRQPPAYALSPQTASAPCAPAWAPQHTSHQHSSSHKIGPGVPYCCTARGTACTGRSWLERPWQWQSRLVRLCHWTWQASSVCRTAAGRRGCCTGPMLCKSWLVASCVHAFERPTTHLTCGKLRYKGSKHSTCCTASWHCCCWCCLCSAFMELLSAGLVDLVFANEDEAAALLEVLAAPNSTSGGYERQQQ